MSRLREFLSKVFNRNSRLFKFLLKLIVSTGLLALLICHSDLVALRVAMARIRWQQILTSTMVLVALTPLLAWRWRSIAHAIGVSFSMRSSMIIVLVGTFFNQILPSAIGGDAVRVWLLKSEQVSLGKCLSSIFLDRVVALVGMALIVFLGLPVLKDIVHLPSIQNLVIVAALGFIGVCTLLFLDKIPLPGFLRALPLIEKLPALAPDARAVFFVPRALATALGTSILIHLMVSISVWTLSIGIGLSVNLGVFVLLLPLVLLLSLLPISIAGWGIREGAMVTSLGFVGVDTASALAVSVLFGLTYILAGIPGGIVWLVIGGKKRRKAQQFPQA